MLLLIADHYSQYTVVVIGFVVVVGDVGVGQVEEATREK